MKCEAECDKEASVEDCSKEVIDSIHKAIPRVITDERVLKVINEIIDETGVTIDIQDSGLILITSEKEEAADKAVAWIKDIIREVKVGEVFDGKVKRILNFGAFVEILPGQEGLIHISKLQGKPK